MFVILNDQGEVLHMSEKPIADRRAVEVEANDQPTANDIVWMVKNHAGEIVDLCDTYPLNPDAVAVRRDHPDVTQYLNSCRQRRDQTVRREEAWQRIVNRLIEEELQQS